MSKRLGRGETNSLVRRVEERMKLKREAEENKKKQQQQQKKKTLDNLVLVPYLPRDCIFNITVRLPLESLIASRFVCKSWYGIINSPSFIDVHLQRSTTGMIYLTPAMKVHHLGTAASASSAMRLDFNVDAKVMELDSIPLLHWHLFNPRTQYQIKYLEIKDGQSTIKDYNATCTGLIKTVCNGLIVLENVVKGKGLIIMNPVTREMKKIPLGTMSSSHRESYQLAFCHESMKYKLVHLFMDDLGYIGCEVMDIGSPRWRVVDGPPHGWVSWLGYQPVSAVGGVHWLPDVDHNDRIVSMSLADERFRDIPLPRSGRIHDRIVDMGGSLGFVCHERENHIEVWVLKSLSGGGWVKQHSITTTVECRRNLSAVCCVRDGGEMVFKNGKNEVFGYDQNLQLLRKIEVVNNEWCGSPACFFPHLNSLVHPTSDM